MLGAVPHPSGPRAAANPGYWPHSRDRGLQAASPTTRKCCKGALLRHAVHITENTASDPGTCGCLSRTLSRGACLLAMPPRLTFLYLGVVRTWCLQDKPKFKPHHARIDGHLRADTRMPAELVALHERRTIISSDANDPGVRHGRALVSHRLGSCAIAACHPTSTLRGGEARDTRSESSRGVATVCHQHQAVYVVGAEACFARNRPAWWSVALCG